MTMRRIYYVTQVIVFPAIFALHGFAWIMLSESLAILVYAMKLAFVPFVIIGTIVYLRKILSNSEIPMVVLALAFVILSSAVIAPISGARVESFYFFSDSLGLVITALAIVLFYQMMAASRENVEFFEKTQRHFLYVMSVYTVIYFFASGGYKINLPTETNLAISLLVVSYISQRKFEKRANIWGIFLVFTSSVLSQFRINYGAFLASAVMASLRSAIVSRQVRSLRAVALLTAGAVLVVALSWDVVSDRIQSLALSISGTQVADYFQDVSINARFIEADLILEQTRPEIATLLFGNGFGATFENTGGVIYTKGDYLHHAHSTPFIVFFRNGILGLVVFATPFVLSLFGMLSRSEARFKYSLCLFLFYIALLFDQYLYWGTNFALIIALWLFHFRRRRQPPDGLRT